MNHVDRRTTAVVLVLVASLLGCTGGSSGDGRAKESEGIFDPSDDRSLPPIATADCPDTSVLRPAASSGARLPDLDLACIGSDRTVSLRAISGVPTVLNVWASWCLPCKKEMPAFQRVFTAARGRVAFLGVNVADDERNARATIQSTGISYASVRSAGREMLNALRVPGPPTTLFVDARGALVHQEVGELSEAELRQRIEEHLGVDVPAIP
ncbi:MAG TPA: TlpA disulfide reductase family protein [Mycobacteriales bacterium]|nr:TlpA disulfide reductase family protein [Mycobacteriales bacterium]